MTPEEIHQLVTSVGGLVHILKAAAPTDKLEVYRRLGLKLTYDHGKTGGRGRKCSTTTRLRSVCVRRGNRPLCQPAATPKTAGNRQIAVPTSIRTLCGRAPSRDRCGTRDAATGLGAGEFVRFSVALSLSIRLWWSRFGDVSPFQSAVTCRRVVAGLSGEESVGQFVGCEVPPEDPVEVGGVVVDFLFGISVTDAELVGDQEEIALVGFEQFLLQQGAAFLEQASQGDACAALLVDRRLPRAVAAA
ncbi:hypothetical protein ACW2Q0_20295 [Nocardia sp. R16R-3T]